MKIQYLAIIFLIIIIPMTLLLTMYNQAQINNLSLQLTYNSYLSDATHNAVKAFELNTVNNSYSEVADSLKRDVEAAVNVFLSSMATNLGTSGATNESIAEYVPAILFTLYDGYYIYAPSYNEILGEKLVQKEAIDGTMQNVMIAVPKDELEPPQDKEEDFTHILKPYVYYTMRYVKNSSTDFIVNYTLDNYISIYGKINGDYVTKSGYLVEITDTINNTLSNGVTVEVDSEKLLAVLKRDVLSISRADLVESLLISDTDEYFVENGDAHIYYTEEDGIIRSSYKYTDEENDCNFIIQTMNNNYDNEETYLKNVYQANNIESIVINKIHGIILMKKILIFML